MIPFLMECSGCIRAAVLATTNNSTYWPTKGGAIAFQPGWFRGYATALIYVNLGFGTDGPDGGPQNMSNTMLHPFQLIGPTNNPYPGTVCLPQVPLPANTSISAGDKATIQVVELAQHGAALYSCVDIIFADPGDKRIAEVNETNCFNSSDIGFADMYTIITKEPRTGGGDFVTSLATVSTQGLSSLIAFSPFSLAIIWAML